MQQVFKKYFPLAVLPLLAYAIYYNGLEIAEGGNMWKTGDWLINWYGGPVRRGMAGTLFLFLSDSSGVSVLWITFAAQVSFYLLIYYAILRIYYLRQRDPMWWAILFSPAFILFTFYSGAGGFRKEIIVFAAFAYLCLYYVRGTLNKRHIAVTALLFMLANFSHEPTPVSLPFFFYIFYRASQRGILSKSLAWRSMALFIGIAAASLVFSFIYKGSPEKVWAVCQTVIHRPGVAKNICDGAISWIDKDGLYAANIIASYFHWYAKYYFATLLLSLLPLAFVTGISTDFKKLMAMGFLFVLPLFVIGLDWGRWIQIYTFFVFTTLLAESVYDKIEFKKFPVIMPVFYFSSWTISHCCMNFDNTSLLEWGANTIIYLFTGKWPVNPFI